MHTKQHLTISLLAALTIGLAAPAFGQEIKADKAQAQDSQIGPYRKLATRMLVTLFFLNIIPILATDAAALIYSGIAAVLIWLPANYLDKMNPE